MRRFGILFIITLFTLAAFLYYYIPQSRLFAMPLQEEEATAILVGAGDIAGCSTLGDEETAALLDSIPGAIFTVGDNAYNDGSIEQFNDCYEPSWGRHKIRTKPAVGNHEYHIPGAEGYFTYWGDQATPLEPGCRVNCKGYYSYELDDWHIIVLNSEIGMSASSAQNQWLQADLAANAKACTLAMWHKPLFSSGQHGNWSGAQATWNVLYAQGVDVVLNGHDHNYERFARQDPNGNPDPANGIREFVVGMGGKALRPFLDIKANSEVRNSDTFGVLKLTLRATGYDWEFVPVAGKVFRDNGSDSCVGASNVPTLTATPIGQTTNTATPIPTDPFATSTPTTTPTPVGTPAAFDTLYLSSSSGGIVDEITFADEDILAYNLPTGLWSKVFDGSHFGLNAVDVGGFDFLSDGSLVMSFDISVTLPSAGEVTVNDLVRFIPNQPGDYSSGLFSLFLDGSDVGLTNPSENIDAVAFAPDGRLIVSTIGDFRANGVDVNDEDLMLFTGRTGSNSAGVWSQYFDGSDLGMNNSSEDIWSVWVAPNNELYLSTFDGFSLQGVIKGERNDIFICDPDNLGTQTTCELSIFWSGSDHGFGTEQIDDFALASSFQLQTVSLANDPNDPSQDDSSSSDLDEDRDDGNENGSDDDLNDVFYLPWAARAVGR